MAKKSRYYVDPRKKSTQVNHPAPSIPQSFLDELLSIGGTHLDKRPRLRVVWGQTRRRFRFGKQRLLYIDTRIPAQQSRITRHILINRKTKEEREVTHQEAISELNPLFLYVTRESKKIEWIGQANFFIEQLIPAEHIKDTPVNWELNRWDIWEDPEEGFKYYPMDHPQRHLRGKIIPTDCCGPFPFNGRYQEILKVTKSNGDFRELGGDILDEVRLLIKERDARPAGITANLLASQYADAIAAARRKRRDELAYSFKSEISASSHRFSDKLGRVYLNTPATTGKGITRFGKATHV